MVVVMVMMGVLRLCWGTVVIIDWLAGIMIFMFLFTTLVAGAVRWRDAIVTRWDLVAVGGVPHANLIRTLLVVVIVGDGAGQHQPEGHSYEEQRFCDRSHDVTV